MSSKIDFVLALQNTKFNRALKASTEIVSRSGKKMAASLRPVASGFARISKNITAIGTASAAAVTAISAYKGLEIIKESVKLAGEQEAAETKLAAVIKATGGAAGFTAKELYDYAGQLQNVTTYGDEVTISAMAMLSTFKKIKGDSFKRATVAAQDMAAAIDTISFDSAMMQIGKALNDPIKGLGSLSRAGVQFSKSQKKMIASLQESGDILGAQKIILEELEGQFGGTAAALRKNFIPGVTAAENALGDYEEEIGFAITKNEFFIKAIELIEKQIVSYTKYLQQNRAEVRQYAKETALAIVGMAETTLTVFDGLYRAGNALTGTFRFIAASALTISGSIFALISAQARLTDFVGLTNNAYDKWALNTRAAFGAAEDLATKTGQNIKNVFSGSAEISKAKQAVRGFYGQLSKIPPKYHEIASAGSKSANDQQGSVKKATDAMRAAYKKYADEVKRLQDSISQKEKSLAQELRELDRSAMTDLSAWKDRKAEAEELYRASNRAFFAAKKALRSGDEEGAKQKFQEAAEAADRAKELYKELNGAVEENGRVIISQYQASREAMYGVEKAGKVSIKILKEQQKAAKKAGEELDKSTGGELSGKLNEITEKQPDKFNRNWNSVWDNFLKDGKGKIADLQKGLDALAKDRHMKIYVKEVLQKSKGGAIHRFRSGGKLSGYGGGDRIPALLEAGEFIIRKEAVSRYGAGIFHALNSIKFPELPRYAAGGPVGAAAATSSPINLTVNFPANTPPASQTNARQQAKMLAVELEKALRYSS